MDENNWNISKDNKKSGKKRFLRQLIVFILTVLIIIVVGATLYLLYNNKKDEPVNKNIAQNSSKQEDIVNKVENTATENKKDKTIKNTSIKNMVYSIKDKDFYFEDEEKNEENGIKLYEYNNEKNDCAELYYCLMSYSTDPSYKYTIEAKNKNGDSIILNDRLNSISEREVRGGIVSSIKIDKEKVGDEIEITVKEMQELSSRSRILKRKGTITLNLKNDLEEQENIDFAEDSTKHELEDIKFETYKNDEIYKDISQMASPNCQTTYYSIDIPTQYGNRLVNNEHIEFSALNNINNLSLDEAFDIEMKIEEKMGHYGLADQYKIFATNKDGDITNEFDITFEDMKDLIDGKDVKANGKRITLKDITNEETFSKVEKSSKVLIAGEITAIKYNFVGDTDYTRYMFMLDGNIYYIVVPNDERCKERVDLFLSSLEKK